MVLVRRISNNSEQRDAATKRPLDREDETVRERRRKRERETYSRERKRKRENQKSTTSFAI